MYVHVYVCRYMQSLRLFPEINFIYMYIWVVPKPKLKPQLFEITKKGWVIPNLLGLFTLELKHKYTPIDLEDTIPLK